MATAGTILTRAQQYGFGSDSATAQLSFLNDALRDLYDERGWQWRESTATLTTTTGTIAVTTGAPTDLGSYISARIVDGSVSADDLDFKEPTEFRRLEQLAVPVERSKPIYWTEWGGILRVFPHPDKAYSIVADYLKTEPTALVSGDEVPVPNEYEDVLLYDVLKRLGVRQRDNDFINWAESERQNALRRAERDNASRQRETEATVGQSRSRWRAWNEGR